MANPDKAYGCEDGANDSTGSIILLLLVFVAPLIYFGGAFFGFWGISSNSTPTYDSTGEVMNDDEYYERTYNEHQVDQAAEAHSVMCEPCFEKFYCNQMSSCEEAYHCLTDCGMTRLDGDSDGVPCEVICENQ